MYLNFYIVKLLLQFNLIFLFFIFILSIYSFIYSKNFKNKNNFTNQKYLLFKKINIFLLIVSFWVHVISILLFIIYIYNLYSLNIVNNYIFFTNYVEFFYINFYNLVLKKISFFYLSIDFFGLILIFLSFIVGYLSLLVLDSRLYIKNNKFLIIFNFFILITYLFVSTTNLLYFILFYECLLLPSFLFVYFISPSKKSIQASIYFVIWTQLGSLVVLCAILYIVTISNYYDFFLLKFFKFNYNETLIIYSMFFIGFGIKIPIWPFHYWLTKTHVEAPSGFSMYLSGYLVKTALFGFYKIVNIVNINISSVILISILLIGIFDASFKMWGQIDLKKLVAYCTIQEMNLIFLTFVLGDINSYLCGILFSITHSFLSCLMFFVVDCVYKRYKTRSVLEINGILHLNPNLGINILIMCFFFSGIPGTIKFVSEFYLFSGLLELSSYILIITILITNGFGIIGFSKLWFNTLFGLNIKKLKYLVIDLTFKENLIIFLCFFYLVILSYIPVYIL